MLTKAMRGRERGQILVFAALVIAFVLGGLLSAVADLVVRTSEQTQADTAAELGAVSGAQAVDPAQFAGGIGSTTQLQLGPDAVPACQEAARVADPGIDVTCAVSGSRVTVHITKHIHMPVPFFGLGSTIEASHQAGAALGTVAPY
jgi:hypothetical protein